MRTSGARNPLCRSGSNPYTTKSGSFNVNYALAFAADNAILAATTTVDHGSVDLPDRPRSRGGETPSRP